MSAGREQGELRHPDSDDDERDVQYVCRQCASIYREGFDRCPRDGRRLEQDDADPLIGRVLSGRYRVVEPIGEGGMGRVYRALHVATGRAVAIKTLFGDLAAVPRNRLRFSNEARAASRLEHANVVPVIDYGYEPDGPMYLAMELVEGESLADRLAGGPLPLAEAVAIAAQLARGLAHAHSRGVVHRDLKPGNVGLIGDGAGVTPRIFDFGLALVADQGEQCPRLTTTGMVHGTPIYLAPELARGETADARSDLYALGIILHEMVVGRPPFESGGVYEILRQHLSDRPPTLSDRCGRPQSAELEMIVGRLLEKRRERRYASAEQAAEALSSIAASGPTRAPTTGETEAVGPVEPPAKLDGDGDSDEVPQRPSPWHPPAARWLSSIVAAAAGVAIGVVIATDGSGLPIEAHSAMAAEALAAPAPEPEPLSMAEVPRLALAARPALRRDTARREAPRRPTAISVEALSRQYARTGAAVERLQARDRAAGETLRRRYFQAGYARALSQPARRAAVLRRLRRIERAAIRFFGTARAARTAR